MKTHYHVLSGLTGGYMPNTNEMCATRKEAEASARWMAQNMRDAELKVSGSASAGWYDCGDYEYIEITKCNEPTCAEEDFDYA